MSLKDKFNEVDFDGILMEVDDAAREQLHGVLLDMYKDILSVCGRYNLVPYLGGGSALGAIRHKGFIPWDDDFDINMTRSDYEKFAKIFDKELSDRYILNAPNYSENSINRFPKILMKGTKMAEIMSPADKSLQCVFLDIFIIDNVPDNKLHRYLKGFRCEWLEFIAGRVAIYENKNELFDELQKRAGKINFYINRFIGWLFSLRKASVWNDKVDKAIQYSKDSEYCTFATGRKHYFGEILKKDKLFPAEYVPFESIKAPVFKGYDYYLSNLYGDYMTVPPEDKRERHFLRELDLGGLNVVKK